ncbi:MAG: hypothetical protein HY712_07520 [candidate division NC10 bacterium]|nr:hypothetical protein [candidate division NC10 bacterium]
MFSGFMAAWFLRPAGEARKTEIARLKAEIAHLRETLAASRPGVMINPPPSREASVE